MFTSASILFLLGCPPVPDEKLPSPPTAPKVRLVPAEAGTDDDLRVDFIKESTDEQGDAISYRYAWSVNGAARPSLSGDTVSASETAKGDVWSVRVFPSDGAAEGDPGSAEITVANTGPVASVVLSPESAGTATVLVAEVTLFDADDDDLASTITWTVDGEVVATDVEELDGAEWFEPGQTVRVTVETVDDEGAVSVASDEVLITNAEPELLSVSFFPSFPITGSNLQCAASAEDADGDALSYSFAWEVDGAAWTGSVTTTEHAGDTVKSSALAGGQEWTCTVTASDGSAESASGSVSAVITEWAGPRDFSTAGVTGAYGPTARDCATAYRGTTLSGDVECSGGVQVWTVPVTGTYLIEAAGAQGAAAFTGYAGGRGAYQAAEFTFTKGATIYVIVGQQGSGAESLASAGGGGGTWVFNDTPDVILLAGGGGGVRTEAYQDGCDGQAGEYATKSSADGATNACAVRSDGLAQGGSFTPTYGAGGAGYSSSGTDDTYESSVYGSGGSTWTEGFYGGTAEYSCVNEADGGFGGGGSGNGCYGGGGGGGYSGGDGGYVAGGAGSYNGGSAPVRITGDNEGDGWVRIDLVR